MKGLQDGCVLDVLRFYLEMTWNEISPVTGHQYTNFRHRVRWDVTLQTVLQYQLLWRQLYLFWFFLLLGLPRRAARAGSGANLPWGGCTSRNERASQPNELGCAHLRPQDNRSVGQRAPPLPWGAAGGRHDTGQSGRSGWNSTRPSSSNPRSSPHGSGAA